MTDFISDELASSNWQNLRISAIRMSALQAIRDIRVFESPVSNIVWFEYLAQPETRARMTDDGSPMRSLDSFS